MSACSPFTLCYLQGSACPTTLVLTFTATRLNRDEVQDALLRELAGALDESRIDRVILDFERVEFIANTALNPLMLFRKRIMQRGGKLALCGLAPPLQDVFRLLRLIGPGSGHPPLFEVRSDAATALEYLCQT